MLIKNLAAASLIAIAAGGFGSVYASQAASHLSADTNGDGSISLDEAHAAADKKFDALDTKHTGKLTSQQPLSKATKEMARHDKDHSVDKTEYMAGVDAAFKEADPKGTGMLDAKALKTKAGKRFLELVE